MEETAAELPPQALSPGPPPKRRRLRKGTQSCWECKRRKARCNLATATEDVCDGCKRRGTNCISQDLPDRPALAGSNRQLIDRLGHVEALVGRLLQDPNGERRSSSPSFRQSNATPLDDSENSPATVHAEAPEGNGQLSSKYKQLSHELMAAWPSKQDIDTILSISAPKSSFIRAATCTQPTTTSDWTLPSLQSIVQPPSAESHPVLVARRLLILGTCLQGMLSESSKHVIVKVQAIMGRAVTSARDLVTCKDELVDSIEGIECIMQEGMYENYAGNLRQSWLAARRAVTVAQMLGLHRGIKPPSLAGTTYKPDHVWFRLLQFDRYLCLMLGLPQTSTDEGFASHDLLESCTATERMQRLNCVATGRFLQRTHADLQRPEATNEADKLLKEASAELPAQWWVTPTLSPAMGHMDKIRETLRLNDHFMHYHLLLLVHFPYLLLSSQDREYDYNRMTAITVGREILSRFVAFRTYQSLEYYCRGIDILALIASTALCVAHILTHRNEKEGFHFLALQRLSDRGMLEHALENMHNVVGANGDIIATKAAALLERLLEIEDEVAAGAEYTVASCSDSGDQGELGCSVKLSDDGSVLNIYLPYIQGIRIERIFTQGQPGHTQLGSIQSTDQSQACNAAPPLRHESTITLGDYHKDPLGHSTCDLQAIIPDPVMDEWNFKSLDVSFFDNMIQEAPILQTDII